MPHPYEILALAYKPKLGICPATAVLYGKGTSSYALNAEMGIQDTYRLERTPPLRVLEATAHGNAGILYRGEVPGRRGDGPARRQRLSSARREASGLPFGDAGPQGGDLGGV